MHFAAAVGGGSCIFGRSSLVFQPKTADGSSAVVAVTIGRLVFFFFFKDRHARALVIIVIDARGVTQPRSANKYFEVAQGKTASWLILSSQ